MTVFRVVTGGECVALEWALAAPIQVEDVQVRESRSQTDRAVRAYGHRVLVIDDDAVSRELVSACLERAGYRVLHASSGADGITLARCQKPDAVVLDWMMADMEGTEVLAEIRRLESNCPVLMLTARGGVQDRVHGLTLGADDYLAKPFDGAELVARVGAVLRREARVERRVRHLRLGEVRVDLDSRVAITPNGPVSLSKTEFAILELLADRIGMVVSRELMLDAVWGYTRFPSTRTVDTHIWRLRRKIGDGGDEPRWIKRAHGSGYFLEPESALQESEAVP